MRISYAANSYAAYTDYATPSNYQLTLLGPMGMYGPDASSQTGALTMSQVNRPKESVLVTEKWSTDNDGKDKDGTTSGRDANYVFPGYHLGSMIMDFSDSWSWDQQRIPSPGLGGGTSYDKNVNGSVSAHHNDMANFLFVDGHVKNMRPITTNPNGKSDSAGDWWRSDNMWNARRPS